MSMIKKTKEQLGAAIAGAFMPALSTHSTLGWIKSRRGAGWAAALMLLLMPLMASAAPNQFFGSCAATSSNLTGINARISRFTLNWLSMQATNGGPIDWNAAGNPATDAVIAALLDGGKDVVLVAGAQWPAWTGSDSTTRSDPPTAAQVAAFARAAAVHYYGLRNRRIFMEIMNEPNVTIGWDSASISLYKNILAQSRSSIRSVLTSSQVTILGVVLAGTPWMQNANDVTTFWNGVTTGTNPVQNNMDVISYHVYTIDSVNRPPEIGHDRGGPLRTRLINSRNLIRNVGFNGPIWITEGGWPTQAGEKPPVTEAQQARWIVRMAVISKGEGLNRFLQFRFQDTGVLHYGLIRSDGTQKPSYSAYRTLCGVLDDTAVGPTNVTYNQNGLCHYRYTKPNGVVGHIVWTVTEGSSAQVGISVGTNRPVYTKAMSQPGAWTPQGDRSGTYTVTATPNPMYIEVR